MGLQEETWFFQIIRPIFGFFDRLIYRLIKWVLYGVFDLSALSTNSEVFNGIYSRIYVILGVFMAFKLSWSFFQYIINPDSMSGKSEQGVGKIFTRVFLMLFALMFLPAILFGQNGSKGLLARAQDAFLPVVPRLIFGSDSIAGNNTTNGATNSIDQISDEISLTILQGFFFPSKEVDTVCAPDTSSKYENIKSIDEFAEKLTETCAKRDDARNIVNLGTKYYVYSYMPFVSTLVGILVVALLLGITLDVAKRIFKLIILEIIAPIPIMSLMDPKSSKGGAFQNWTKSLISTFIDIFLKFGLLYLVIVLIHMIVKSHESGGLFSNFPEFSDNPLRSSYLILILILGLILFAKEAPKFIKDAIGVKSDGGSLFDDVKMVGKAAGLVAGGAGIIGSAIASGRASYDSDTVNGRNHNFGRRLKNVGAGLIGGIAGAGTAVKAATGKDGGLGSVLKAQSQRNANALARGASGSSWLGRRSSELSSIFAGQTPANQLERQLDDFKARKEYFETIANRVKSKMPEKTYTYGEFGNGVLSGYKFNYNNVMAAVESAKASGSNVVDITDSTGTVHTGVSLNDINIGLTGLVDSNEADFYSQVLATPSKDTTLSSFILRNKDVGLDNPYANFVGMKTAMGENNNLIYQTGRRVNKAKANDRYSATKK